MFERARRAEPAVGLAHPTSAADRLARLRASLAHPEQRYTIDGEVGRGGMGAVFRVRDAALGRHLAMKVIRLEGHDDATPHQAVDPVVLERFLEEAQITGQLDHPGIVPVHELGVDADGRAYFTMKLVRGRTADAVFADARVGRDGWDRTRALEILIKVCDALAFAHEKGVLHRDLKPTNVMVGRFGEVYVMDWGLAKVLGQRDRRDLRIRPEGSDSRSRVRTERAELVESDPDSPLVTMDGAVVGTPCYMSPEQAEGRIETLGPHSDVYSIGAMLYTLLTGWQPYLKPGARVSPYTILRWVQDGPPKPVREIAADAPAALVAICERAMAREPSARYADTRQVGDDLRAFLADRVVRAYRTGALVEARLWVRRNRAFAFAALAALALLVAGGVSSTLLAWSAMGNAARAQRAEQATARERDQVKALSVEQEARLVQGAWVAVNQADRLLEAAETAADPFVTAQYRREALLLLARALQFDPSNRVASYRFAWEASAHGELFRLPIAVHAGRFPVWSPDGARLCVTTNGRARLIDPTTGDLAGWMGTENWVRPAFSHDGRCIVTARPVDGSARWVAEIWEVASGRRLGVLPAPPNVRAIAFDDTGNRLLMVEARLIQVWRVGAAELICDIPQAGIVEDACFTADGKAVLVASSNEPSRSWDASTGELRATFWPRRNVVLSPDGERLLHRSGTNTLVVESSVSGTASCRLRHPGPISEANFSEDGLRLATISAGRATVWDARTGDVVRMVPGPANDVRIRPDGAYLVTEHLESDAVKVWDLGASRLEIARTSGDDVAFRSDGDKLVTRNGSVLDCRTGTYAHFVVGPVLDVSFAADGHARLLTRWRGLLEPPATDAVVDVRVLLDDQPPVVQPRGGYRLGPSRRVCTLDHGTKVTHCAISRDAMRALTATSGATARVWDAATGQLLSVLAGHPTLQDARFCADGRRLLTIDARRVEVWDVTTGERIAERANEAPQLAVIDPSGAALVTVDQGRTLLSRTDGESPPVFLEPPYPGGRADFRADGSVLTFGGGSIFLSDPEGRVQRRWALDRVPTQAVFSADGEQVIACAWGRVELIDIRTGKRLCALRSEALGSALLGPGGTRLVTSGGSGKLVDLALPAGLIGGRATTADADRAVQLAELVTGQGLTPHGELIRPEPDREAQARAAIVAQRGDSSPLSSLARWLAAHGPDAPLTPGCSISRRQRVSTVLRNASALVGGGRDFSDAYALDPSDPLAVIGMAANEVPGPAREFLCELGLLRLPADAHRWSDAAWMFLDMGDKARALRAATRALEFDAAHEEARRVKELAGM